MNVTFEIRLVGGLPDGDEEDVCLHDFHIINAEFAFFVRLAGFKDLFYCDWSKGFFAVCRLDKLASYVVL